MTAQSSPDLPASLQRTTRIPPGDDVITQALIAAHDAACPDRTCSPTHMAWLAGPVRAVVELTEQRVRAETAAEVQRLTEERDTARHFNEHCQTVADRWAAAARQLTDDLAAMTARAESAETMYDRTRPLVDACRRYLDRPDSDTIRQAVRAYDETGPLDRPESTLPAWEGQDGGESGSTVDRGSEGISGGAA